MIVQYLRKNRRHLAAGMFCCIIFGVVFYLYNLPGEIILYASLLSAVAAGMIGIPGYLKFCARVKALREMRERIQLTMENLPEADNRVEESYQELMEILFKAKCEADNEAAVRYTKMLDYYTMWAHQIKTPIAAMRLLLQTENTLQSEELGEQLFKIEQYVEMVLQYLRMDNMNSDLLIRQYSLDKIVKQAVRKYAKSFIRRKISLDYEELGCRVITDEKWLVFVIEQLLSNAIKYTRSGKISIYMAPRREKTLVIEDTGIGIQGEDLPRIFEKGYTGYNGRTDKKSTGIGLYLCKSILTKLNHTIWIESEPGEGTRVYLDLKSAELQVD